MLKTMTDQIKHMVRRRKCLNIHSLNLLTNASVKYPCKFLIQMTICTLAFCKQRKVKLYVYLIYRIQIWNLIRQILRIQLLPLISFL